MNLSLYKYDSSHKEVFTYVEGENLENLKSVQCQKSMVSESLIIFNINRRAVARALIGGGCIFIYSGSARLVSFEIKLISKEVSRAEPKYMNIHPPN